jgi:hypothetical protein
MKYSDDFDRDFKRYYYLGKLSLFFYCSTALPNIYSRHCVLNLESKDFLRNIATASSRFKSALSNRLHRKTRVTLSKRNNFCKILCKQIKNFYLWFCIKGDCSIHLSSCLMGAKGLECETPWSNIFIVPYVSIGR